MAIWAFVVTFVGLLPSPAIFASSSSTGLLYWYNARKSLRKYNGGINNSILAIFYLFIGIQFLKLLVLSHIRFKSTFAVTKQRMLGEVMTPQCLHRLYWKTNYTCWNQLH